jgi:hypothetical protein
MICFRVTYQTANRDGVWFSLGFQLIVENLIHPKVSTLRIFIETKMPRDGRMAHGIEKLTGYEGRKLW